MNFNLRQLVAAVAVASASFGAVAATSLGNNPDYVPITGYGTTMGPVTFEFSFTLDSATNFSDFFGELAATDATSLTVSLTGPTLTTPVTFAAIPNIPGSFSFSALADGAYVLSVLATPSSSTFTAYGGYVTSAAAVPEPESIAMVLAGLGVAGALVRRRKSA